MTCPPAWLSGFVARTCSVANNLLFREGLGKLRLKFVCSWAGHRVSGKEAKQAFLYCSEGWAAVSDSTPVSHGESGRLLFLPERRPSLPLGVRDPLPSLGRKYAAATASHFTRSANNGHGFNGGYCLAETVAFGVELSEH
jgi:hypothetical protein